jgi:hypothetical protein
MQPYQLWRRREISYATYLARMNETYMEEDETVDSPIDPGDYDMIVSSVFSVTGNTEITTLGNGILVSSLGSIEIVSGGSLIVN